MRQIKHVFMMIGVALCVTPIFSMVSAQQGNSQAQMLFEMQALRQEISELRDMVERQQYEIRKLKRASTTSSPAIGTGQRYPSTGTTGDVYSPGARVGGAPQGSNDYSTAPGQDYGSQNEPVRNSVDSGSSARYVENGTAEAPPINAGRDNAGRTNASRAYGDPTNAGRTNAGTVSGENGVEERVITAPLVSGPVTDYPPVEERSIGGTTSAPVEELPSVSSTSGPSSGEWQSRSPSAPTYQNQPVQVTPQVGSGPGNSGAAGGVLAVPQIDPNVSQPRVSQQDTQVAVAQPSTNSQAISTSLEERDYYSQGFDLLKQSKYEEAAEVFEQQLKAYPKGDLADDAHYWIAEAMHVSRKLDVAKTHLKEIIDNYPQSRRLPDAMLKTAYIEQQQGNEIEARILFQEIVNYHPKSDAAIAAKNRLASSN